MTTQGRRWGDMGFGTMDLVGSVVVGTGGGGEIAQGSTPSPTGITQEQARVTAMAQGAAEFMMGMGSGDVEVHCCCHCQQQ